MASRYVEYKGRLVLSKTSTLNPTVLCTYHDSVFGGHSDYLWTYKRLTSELYWEGMKGDVKKYVEECVVCQKKVLSSVSSWVVNAIENFGYYLE